MNILPSQSQKEKRAYWKFYWVMATSMQHSIFRYHIYEIKICILCYSLGVCVCVSTRASGTYSRVLCLHLSELYLTKHKSCSILETNFEFLKFPYICWDFSTLFDFNIFLIVQQAPVFFSGMHWSLWCAPWNSLIHKKGWG